MKLVQLDQSSVGEHVNVLPGSKMSLAVAVNCQRIAKTTGAVSHIRQRERLPAGQKGGNVVPAREVLGRCDGVTAGCQDSRHLAEEAVGISQMLDDLVAAHDIKAGVRVWQAVGEVAN